MTIDGPGGVGKSTTTRYLHRRLATRGYDVYATAEPSDDALGRLARRPGTYTKHALACLVAADRYHHLDTEIHPALRAGRIVVSDRYVPSSYVLQRIDGVPLDFIEAINTDTDIPDLAVLLTAARSPPGSTNAEHATASRPASPPAGPRSTSTKRQPRASPNGPTRCSPSTPPTPQHTTPPSSSLLASSTSPASHPHKSPPRKLPATSARTRDAPHARHHLPVRTPRCPTGTSSTCTSYS
ncbi:MAG: dTMP kinase [Pseudonocardia sp.]|nr:dTMP kinase [Pseudonocardia sp.]